MKAENRNENLKKKKNRAKTHRDLWSEFEVSPSKRVSKLTRAEPHSAAETWPRLHQEVLL